MISLLQLNKIKLLTFLFVALHLNFAFADNDPNDIWEDSEQKIEKNSQTSQDEDIKIESPILSKEINKIVIAIDEDKIDNQTQSVIGIFDPAENNFNLDMWSQSDGDDIKKILKRISKLKLLKLSEELLFQVLFTNSYPPKKNLNPNEFLKIKVNWLIKRKRIKDLENLLKNNKEVGKNSKAIEFLINEYLSSADIKSACEKVKFIDRNVQNNYLDKFTIYCLINSDRKSEAQLNLDLLLERGFKDKFFENKIYFLLGVTEKNSQKIMDNNLLNFYLSHITSKNFEFIPTEKTNKYIWRYLSSANLIEVKNFENEDVILTYEQAASQNSFEKNEIFKIYLRMDFNFNQLLNAKEIYKNLPNYKARALIYQSILLNSDLVNKIDLIFLLKKLFINDKIFNIYEKEFFTILKSIDLDEVPSNYADLIKENLDKNVEKKIKFDNDILHRSKIIKHFLDNNIKLSRTEKDFKSVYKKIKRNKKYFISIKDIIVLESLIADGVSLPTSLNYSEFSSKLTVPKSLEDLAAQNQIGLVMLKIVEIIGEDQAKNLDPETVYFLVKILNQLNIKKIRNNILNEVLPTRI